ncbi:MAG: hypothetical protein JSS82_15735 [Bacteroidetes bacterium]|nr:hypothetical protein [Bacteroidota bacterium]
MCLLQDIQKQLEIGITTLLEQCFVVDQKMTQHIHLIDANDILHTTAFERQDLGLAEGAVGGIQVTTVHDVLGIVSGLSTKNGWESRPHTIQVFFGQHRLSKGFEKTSSSDVALGLVTH